jgi:hypothetical protein
MSHDRLLPWLQRQCNSKGIMGRDVFCAVHAKAVTGTHSSLQPARGRRSWALTRKPWAEQYSLESGLEEYPLLEELNQAMTNGGYNNLRKLV